MFFMRFAGGGSYYDPSNKCWPLTRAQSKQNARKTWKCRWKSSSEDVEDAARMSHPSYASEVATTQNVPEMSERVLF